MSLLGIDVGTTGCKVALFSLDGEMLESAYREYDAYIPQPGWAELDPAAIWEDVKNAIRSVTTARPGAVIRALSVSSLGEATVPVSVDRHILGPSILNFDSRGEEFLEDLAVLLPDERLYAINGNTLGNHYSLTKLKWFRAHQPELYYRTYKFLHWSAFIAFMLGADPVVDYSLANRTLLFDIQKCDWSESLLEDVGLDRSKLPATAPSGTVVGMVSKHIANELSLPQGVFIILGAHDQCANAVGCGVVDSGSAVYGMGTYHCITPVFAVQPATKIMIERGLNTEHHAIPDRYVCFIYNQGGSLVKWFRDTFAAAEHRQAEVSGRSVYPTLFAEIPEYPSTVMVLPHFTTTGPPEFIADSSGLIAGLRLETSRGDVLKGIIEGAAFYLKEVVDSLPETGIQIEDYRVVGGGSQSDVWVQTCADIFGKAFIRPVITEAGALGAAIIAGVGSKVFKSYPQGVAAMVKPQHTFEPDLILHERYQARYQNYQRLWPLLVDYL
ncbi:MAG: FGGY-family carbohydrate kinase [Anaerolineales bacterium]|jgi:xylulokinase